MAGRCSIATACIHIHSTAVAELHSIPIPVTKHRIPIISMVDKYTYISMYDVHDVRNGKHRPHTPHTLEGGAALPQKAMDRGSCYRISTIRQRLVTYHATCPCIDKHQ